MELKIIAAKPVFNSSKLDNSISKRRTKRVRESRPLEEFDGIKAELNNNDSDKLVYT